MNSMKIKRLIVSELVKSLIFTGLHHLEVILIKFLFQHWRIVYPEKHIKESKKNCCTLEIFVCWGLIDDHNRLAKLIK